MQRRANFGLDAPTVVLALALGGAVLIAMGARISGLRWLVLPGGFLVAEALLMIWSSRFGKRTERGRLLDRIEWRGNETVLDVGCGRGLLLLGAARRLRDGLAIGVDRWSWKQQTGNRPRSTLANAEAEGVADRVAVCTGDACGLPFPDATFDTVLSSLALHSIHSGADRRRAVAEIARVVKPGGRVLILDIRHTGQYARALRDRGFVTARSRPTFRLFPPARTVVARLPATAGTAASSPGAGHETHRPSEVGVPEVRD